MVNEQVTTIELTAGTPQTIEFSGAYPYYWVNNLSDSEAYASLGTPEAGSDGTYTIAAGSQLRISGGAFNTKLYLLGSGKVQVIASAIASCPFRGVKKGGGYAVAGASSYALNNAVDYPLLGLNLYGKSMQDGTPTPDSPVDIVSVGDSGSLTITVDNGDSISATASITSALPLCGIPVESGGNYTDSNGQQWICDEFIYNADGTGKIIKRTGKIIFDGSEDWSKSGVTEIDRYILRNVSAKKGIRITAGLCNTYIVDTSETSGTELGKILLYPTYYDQISVNFAEYGTSTVETFKDYLKNNPIVLCTDLIEPQEIELTASEITALRQLQTYSGITNVSNDSGADMDVKICTNKMLSEYVMPITTGLQKQIDELQAAILSLGSNV